MLNQSKIDTQKYWDNYTGKEGWATWDGYGLYGDDHNSRVRINYTYYNSWPLMQRIIAWYQEIDPDGRHCDYSVIDDGSQKDSIKDHLNDIPDHWKVYLIPEDMGWNNEGARNCLMKETSNKWNLLLDSDYVITQNNLKKIVQAAGSNWLDNHTMYYPGNFGPSQGRNSYLITKQEFWRRGGYDQCFIGYHGNDYSMHRFDEKYDHSDFFRFCRIETDVVSPEEKDRMNEVMRFHNHMKDLEAKGYGYRNPQDKQDFNWTDMKARKTYWKSIDYKRIK